MKRLMSIVVALAVASCGPTLIVLRDPKTGQMAQCQTESGKARSAGQAEACAQAYESVGYVRLTQ